MITHASQRLGAWRALRDAAGRLFVALDFDGTLSPIVDRPEEARMVEAARPSVSRLAARPDTVVAVVSGRGLADVRARVGLPDLIYAGNHGFEIEGRSLHREHPEAAAARPALESVADVLRSSLSGEAGVELEDKGWTLTVHYRRAPDPDAEARVRRAVAAAVTDPGLMVTEGKKVLEVRPAVEWDKGRAVLWLLEVLEEGGAMPPALYIGDDRTDEDAFRALRGRGEGVVVADPPPPDTAATAFLRSPDEVAEFLDGLAR